MTGPVRKVGMELKNSMTAAFNGGSEPAWKLWLYTNYDCNLRCEYCVARSSPKAARRALGVMTVRRAIDEAHALNIEGIYFTGGEPFLLTDIYEMLAYSCERFPTTVLTNGMLFAGSRLEQLKEITHPNLTIQVSLDGGKPEHHDPYRGAGSWTRTVAGIQALKENGFHVRLSTTQTPANTGHLDELCDWHTTQGINETDHIIRPLARRGFSTEGLEITLETIAPEITITDTGVYWHPLGPEEDFLISSQIFPLAAALEKMCERLAKIGEAEKPKSFQ